MSRGGHTQQGCLREKAFIIKFKIVKIGICDQVFKINYFLLRRKVNNFELCINNFLNCLHHKQYIF